MALAVAEAPSASRPQKTAPASLSWYGMMGTVYVVLAYLGITHLVPWAWAQVVPQSTLATSFGLFLAIGLAVVLAGYLWNKLFPPIYGLRAAVTVGVGNLLLGFIVIMLAGYLIDAIIGRLLGSVRMYVGMALMAAMALWWINRFIVKAFAAPSFPKRMQKFEDGLWFTTEAYKKVQGMRIRRIVMLVILATVGLGVYYYIWARGTMTVAGSPYVWDIPFVSTQSLVLFRAPGLTIPVILLGLALWFAYRLVNHPPMAEFLINTEAEMAKVTWTSRKRLIRDTGVVLLTVFLLAAFLYVLDIVWVLILTTIGVLQH